MASAVASKNEYYIGLFSLVGFALLIASCASDNWQECQNNECFRYDADMRKDIFAHHTSKAATFTKGLWKQCCSKHFGVTDGWNEWKANCSDTGNKDEIIVRALMIAGIIFIMIALGLHILQGYCWKEKDLRAIMFLLMALAVSLVAASLCVYTVEVKGGLSCEWGYGYILGWVSLCCYVVTFGLVIAFSCNCLKGQQSDNVAESQPFGEV